MSNIKFKFSITRVPVIQQKNNKQPLIIGEVEEYKRDGDVVSVNVRLADNMPQAMQTMIEKNPGAIQILETFGKQTDVLIIPTRPGLILPQ